MRGGGVTKEKERQPVIGAPDDYTYLSYGTMMQ
jgi:hypothetical protein